VKILKEGHPLTKAWIGRKFVCDHCKCEFDLGAEDIDRVKTRLKTGGMYCCDEKDMHAHHNTNCPACNHNTTLTTEE